MWTKLLAGAYFAVLISLAISHEEEESSTEGLKKVQKYRIVKVYGRKLKTTTTIPTTPVAPPLKVGQPVTQWWDRKTEKESSSSEESHHQPPRDMLREESGRENTVNLGHMELENFDIGKLLAAAGHSSSGDPLAPTVIRFSVPSSSSHLDPEYLSKLIREQLGNEFQILPPSGKNDGDSFKQIFGNTNRPPPGPPPGQSGAAGEGHQLQFRGGFKHSPPPQQLTSPAPGRKPNTYPAQRVTTHYDGRKAKEIKHESTVHGFQNQIPVPPEENRPRIQQFPQPISSPPQYTNQASQIFQITPKPQNHQQFLASASTQQRPTHKFPLYPRNPAAESQRESGPINYNGLQQSQSKPTPAAPAPTTIYEKFSTPSSSSPSQESFNGFQLPPDKYSTLSQQMTAPGLTPGITGQYAGQQQEPNLGKQNVVIVKNEVGPSRVPASKEQPKYSTTFVRGFNDNGHGGARPQEHIKYSQIPTTRSPPATAGAQQNENQWKAFKELSTRNNFQNSPSIPQPPSRTFSPPLPESPFAPQFPPPPKFRVLKPIDTVRSPQPTPGFDTSDFYQQNQPSRSESENRPSYAKSVSGWDNNDGDIEYGFTTPTTPHHQYPEYEPNPQANVHYGPPPSEHGQQTAQYGSPPPSEPQALAQYGQPSGYDHHDPAEPPPPPGFTKTIYVNLPPEISSTTPPPKPRQFLLPQKHYKIVFVKAPTAPPPEEPEIEVTPSPETKTIIYVLHKKPELAPKIVIKAPPVTKPPSPEVFFIQYKDNKDKGYKNEAHQEEQQVKWEDPIGNQGWERESSPPSSRTEDYSRGGQGDRTNNWSPVYNSNESHSGSSHFQNGFDGNDDEFRDYPDTQYQMSASVPIPVRVSVKKTVTTKI